jgi:hypothetical protein
MPRSAPKIVEDLRQTNSAKRRTYAIPEFVKALRGENGFQSMWETVGGANGLASLMAEFSVRDLRELSKRLGMTASARQVQPQRRAALGELVIILFESPKDGRPLNRFYQNILPACHLDIIQRFEQPWTRFQQQCLLAGHREQNETKFLDEISSKDLLFSQHKSLFRGNIPLTEKILTTILVSEKCPPDLIDEVVMPLLKRLLKSRYDNETRNRYLRLVLQVVRKHEEEIAGQLCLTKGGLVQYIVDRWCTTGSESKRQLKSYLEEAVELLPPTSKSRAMDLGRIQQAICVSTKLNYEERYELFRLFLLNMKDYQIDIESDSEQDLSRLKLLLMWPSSLFFSMGYPIRLFEKMDKLFPQRDFLRVERDQATILNQSQGRIKHSPLGDVEVVKTLLIRRSKTQHEHPGWLQHAVDLVIERRTKAQQSREAVERAYWAISAVHLCVATGDLEALRDTIVWSRRFIKDSTVSSRLYSGDVLRTKEIDELLGAMPDGNVDSPEAATAFTSSLTKKDIELSNQILIELVTTAVMATSEPGFQAKSWIWLFGLVRSTADKRTSNLDVLFDSLSKCTDYDRERCQRDLLETVWKPTIDALIQIGAALEATQGDTLIPGTYRDSTKGIYLYQRLASTSVSPHLLADLTRLLIDQMRARLGSRGLRAQMQSVVSAVSRLASIEPRLACPFIRDLILDEDAKEASSSSWHRHLMSPRFLSILPAKDGERLLRTMASAMREKMREQNNFDLREAERTMMDKTEASDTSLETKRVEPSIKVTTVKMLAQLLQHNLFIDPSSSCEILIGLLSEARHLDIRIAVTKSLFDTLEEQGCPPSIRTKILAALEEYVVPVASQLNERRGLVEPDWAAASEEGENLPIIGQDTPLFDLLIERTRLSKLEEAEKLRLSQFVMSAMEQSAVNNTRWLNLFMTKNKFSLDAHEQLPKLPVHLVQLSKAFIQLMPYTSSSIYKMVETSTFSNIEPPPGIKAITKAIKEDRDLVNSAAGKHWLSQFSSDSPEHNKYNIQFVPFHVAALLGQGPEHRDSKLIGDGVNRTSLQTLINGCVDRMLSAGWAGQIVSLVRRLCDERLKSRENWENWRKNCLPVIEAIILQTKEAQARPRTRDGEPHLLPSLFSLRLKTLPIPLPDGTDEEEQAFVEKLYNIIKNLAGLQRYHTDLERLKEDINYWPLTQSFGRFALKLAAVQEYNLKSTEQPSLKDYLGWEIVAHLLLKANGPKSASKMVRDLLNEWTRFEDDGIRTMGINLERTIQHRDWLAMN